MIEQVTTQIIALDELKKLPHWVCYSSKKMPFNPVTGEAAKADVPATWGSYYAALSAFNRKGSRYAGIGREILAEEGLVLIDLDHCVEEGLLSAFAQKVVKMLNSYTEYSPSGHGLHIWTYGTIPCAIGPDPDRKAKTQIEMYDHGRYFTWTGQHLEGTPETIEQRSQMTQLLHAEVSQERKARGKEPKREEKTRSVWEDGSIASAYAAKAKREECANVALAGEGGRNAQLNRSAFALGQLVAAKQLTQSEVESDLTDAATRAGLDPREIEATLRSGLSRGMEHERDIPTKRTPTYKENEMSIDLTPIEQALDARDAEALIKCSSLIAQLSTQDYALLKIRIKREMGKDISIRDLDRAITEKRKQSQGNDHKQGYQRSHEGMTVPGKEGGDILISNFTAEILEDITTDDGAEQTRGYLIEAEMFGRSLSFEVTAKEFAACNWVDEHLGAKALITTGQSMKSHLVNAIKSVSSPIVACHYAHTGWRKVDGRMVYLHAGGLLSQVSQVANFSDSHLTHHIENTDPACRANLESIKSSVSQVSQVSQVNTIVTLSGSLLNYQFPPEKGDIREAVRASLHFLTLVKDPIGMPLYCSLWRALLGKINYGVHVAGQTGWGKTELVSLLQRHYGSQMDADHLPGSWASTANSLEMLLFQAKDTLVVVDDFKPVGGKVDQARLHAIADRVFRQIGNNSARGRLTSNLEQRAERRPRCMLISTGEDIPRGQSLKARGVVVLMNEKITQGDASKRLLAAQKDARSGLYACAMAAYIEWLAPQIENIQAQLQEEIEEQRETLTIEGHARAGTNTANMLIGLKYFLCFARESGAISTEDEQRYLTRCIAALKQVADDAAKDNHHDKPSEQWRRLVMAALANKSAHLATPDGKCPGIEYGWICTTRTLADGTEEETLRGGGSQIGWIAEGDIYLLPTLAYKVACAMGNATGDDITTLEPTLRKYLGQDGMLASTALSSPRKTLTVRRRLENVQRDVLHIKSETLYPILLDSLDSLDSAPHEVALQAGREVSQLLDSAQEDLTHLTQQTCDTEIIGMVGQFKQIYSKKERIMWIAPGTDVPNASITPAQWYENFKKCWQSGDAKIRDAAIEALRVKIDTAIVRA